MQVEDREAFEKIVPKMAYRIEVDASGGSKVSITCKTGASQFKKHYLGVSDNVTYFIEQLEAAPANVFHYRVTFNPSAMVPDIHLAK